MSNRRCNSNENTRSTPKTPGGHTSKCIPGRWLRKGHA